MHPTAMKHAKAFFDAYLPALTSPTLVEIGALSINGSLRDVCPPVGRYVGVDFAKGPGVDVIIDDPYRLPFDDESADVVASSSCFEHSEFFWVLFMEILRVLKPGGLFYLNAPSNGPFHRHPVDCWRFYPDSGRALVAWARRNGVDPELLESFVGDQRLGNWNDFVAVFVKDRAHAKLHPRRMLDALTGFSNGVKDGGDVAAPFLNPRFHSEDQRFFGWRLQRKIARLFFRGR